MDTERRVRVRAAMERDGLDILVCRMPENVLFLSGYLPLSGVSLLLFPRDSDPICIVPASEESEAAAVMETIEISAYPYATLAARDPDASVANVLSKLAPKLRPRRIGIEGSFTTLAPPVNAAEPTFPTKAGEAQLLKAFGGAQLEDATGLLYELRARKTAPEAERIRIANEIAALGLAAFAHAVSPGVSGIELAAEVEHQVAIRGTGYRGARYVRAFAQVSTGPSETAAGYRPCEISTRRKTVPGDIALLELAVTADGYWADRTRPRIAGEPSADQARLFDLIVRAQDAAISRVRPGVPAGQVDQAARSIVEAAGLSGEFLHITGHGTGFRYHEPIPVLAPGSETVLEEGMVFSVEPGVYSESFGGFRVEDNVLVKPEGVEVLGPAERRLGP